MHRYHEEQHQLPPMTNCRIHRSKRSCFLESTQPPKTPSALSRYSSGVALRKSQRGWWRLRRYRTRGLKEGVSKHACKGPRARCSCISETAVVIAAAPDARSDAACVALLATLTSVREVEISGSVNGFSRKERSLKSMPPEVEAARGTPERSRLGRSCEKREMSMKWVRGHTKGTCGSREFKGDLSELDR